MRRQRSWRSKPPAGQSPAPAVLGTSPRAFCPSCRLQVGDLRRAYDDVHVLVPATGALESRSVVVPASRAAPGPLAPGGLRRFLRLRLRFPAPRPCLPRRPRLGAAGARRGPVPQSDDLAARPGRGRARGPRRPKDPGGGLALELLLLPGGAPATDLSLVVLLDHTR